MEFKAREDIHAFEIRKELRIDAPVEIAFESLLEELGPAMEAEAGKTLSMKLEPWPGGRWFRDLGANSGHLWGIVQSIKAPTLLEIYGQMPMSCAAVNHLYYRLKAEGSGTLLTFVHTAMGLLPVEQSKGFAEGWDHCLEQVKTIAERKAAS